MLFEKHLALNDSPERVLVAAAAGGDDEAVRILWVREYDNLVAMCRRLLGMDHSEAEDIAEDAFHATLLQLRQSGSDGFRFGAYANRVARNSCYRFMRHQARLAEFDEALYEGIAAEPGEIPLEQREYLAAVRELRSMVSDKVALIETSPTVYAAEHGITPEAARARKAYALKKARPLFLDLKAKFSGVMAGLSATADRFRSVIGGSKGGTQWFEAAIGAAAAAVFATGVMTSGIVDEIRDRNNPVEERDQAVSAGDSNRDWSSLHVEAGDGLDSADDVVDTGAPSSSGSPGGSTTTTTAPWGSDPWGQQDVKVVLGGDGESSGTVVDLNPAPKSQETARDQPVYISLLRAPDLNGDGVEDPLIEIGSDPLIELGIPWPDALRLDLDLAGVRKELAKKAENLDPDGGECAGEKC